MQGAAKAKMVGYVPMYLVASPWKLAEAGLDVLLNHGLQLPPSATLQVGQMPDGFVVSDKPLAIKTGALQFVMMLSTDRDLGECRCQYCCCCFRVYASSHLPGP